MMPTPSPVAPDTVARNLARVHDRIATAGGDAGAITVIAVTKGLGPEAVHSAIAAGLVDIGENYAQDLLFKAEQAPAAARWHFLGAVQRNKIRRLAPVVSTWHGVDRLDAGTSIVRRSPGASVLVQVNVSGVEGRNGCREDEAPDLVDALRARGVDVAGLMAVASPGPSSQARAQFDRVARLRAHTGVRELSIGMSDDFEIAVAAGATMLRLGRALFGERS